MTIFTDKARKIIENESKLKMDELAAKPLNEARPGTEVTLMFPERSRGSVRAQAKMILEPDEVIKMRRELSGLEIPQKAAGIGRILRYFK